MARSGPGRGRARGQILAWGVARRCGRLRRLVAAGATPFRGALAPIAYTLARPTALERLAALQAIAGLFDVDAVWFRLGIGHRHARKYTDCPTAEQGVRRCFARNGARVVCQAPREEVVPTTRARTPKNNGAHTQCVLGTGIPLIPKRFPITQDSCVVPLLICEMTTNPEAHLGAPCCNDQKHGKG